MVDVEETKVGAHALLVNRDGKVILQQRDNNPGIVNPGLIAMFGGSLKAGDTLKSGLKRELEEELELNIESYDVKEVCVLYKTKEIDGQDYEAHIFVVKPVDERLLRVHEGSGFVCDYPDNMVKNDKLTRITKLALEKYLLAKIRIP